MSFGFSIGDFLALTQLAWKTVQNSREACGTHDGLTQEITNLHIVLQRLEWSLRGHHHSSIEWEMGA
jgi:hypothetical protein